MVKWALVEKRPWLLASLAAAIAYYFLVDSRLPGLSLIMLKGASVGLLAVYAWQRHASRDGQLLTLVMGLAAIGDIAIEIDFAAGGMAFFFSHVAAMALYLRHRRHTITFSQKLFAVALLLLTPAIAYFLAAPTCEGVPVAIYALVLGGMAGLAWTSSFPRYRVGLGVVLFVMSDLLIFSRMSVLAESALPDLLIWPIYYFGQFLIATGIIQTFRKELPEE
jgi:uncharacterized membrane protein YhhN